MVLSDLIGLIDENIKRVNILDLNKQLLTYYDGKNSINKKYNTYEVKTITTTKGGFLEIQINCIKIF